MTEYSSMKSGGKRLGGSALRGAMLALSALLIFVGQPFGALPNRAGAAPLSQQAVVCTVTPSQTEGPYWKAGSPERTSLIDTPGTVGARVSVSGYVYNTNCQPIANAWVDVWHTDYYGVYDNAGYTFRGHQYTDATGRYHVETIVPGLYTGRTIHIHMKVQAPGGPVLTTQLYFPDVAFNSRDGLYNPNLVVALQNIQGVKTGTYNFTVNTATQSPRPASNDSRVFKETGFTVAGRFWDVWQGGRSFEDSLYINGYPITSLREEVSPTDGKLYKTQWFERARFEQHPENQAPHDVLLGLLGTAAVKGRLSEAPFKPIANPGGRAQWFSQTGHTTGDGSVGGLAIAAFWSQRGDVKQFGLPLSQPFMEKSAEGNSYLVQYFERQRFEYHPEYKGTRYEILLGRLGAEQVK
jgi:protocatechuate 3,4-dioxygenase beta subunit